ncbi:MAG: hypothetical protein IT270_04650 [Saprospiraceae bacterium]|nr:hypothetical protein [Saprospiraceae bacterium]
MEKTTNSPSSSPSPGDNLAEQLFEKLLAEGLITPYGKYVFIQQLAHGELKESHWRNALSQAVHPQNPSNLTNNV